METMYYPQVDGITPTVIKEQGMDYHELINTLRLCASGKHTPRCDTGEDGCFYGLVLEAADAIEELREKYQRLFESTHN